MASIYDLCGAAASAAAGVAVYAGTETLQLWDWLLATDDNVQGGDVAAADLTEARQMAAAAAASSSAATALGQVRLGGGTVVFINKSVPRSPAGLVRATFWYTALMANDTCSLTWRVLHIPS